MNTRFIIFVETVTGEIIRAFTWTRDMQSGINRAMKDAKEFGFTPVRAWAEELQE
jgi:hypothetical protein